MDAVHPVCSGIISRHQLWLGSDNPGLGSDNPGFLAGELGQERARWCRCGLYMTPRDDLVQVLHGREERFGGA